MFKSCAKCGKIHDYNYKCKAGRIRTPKTPDQRLRSSYKWTQKALQTKERSNYLCELCRLEGRYTYDNIEIHHITKVKDEPSKLLDDYNLICLCKRHHELADQGKIDKELLERLARERS